MKQLTAVNPGKVINETPESPKTQTHTLLLEYN